MGFCCPTNGGEDSDYRKVAHASPKSSPVQEVAGKLREEVGQVVVNGMGPRSEA